MKKINEHVYYYINHIKKIEYLSNYIVFYTNESKYIYFDKKVDRKIYDYLLSIDYSNCLRLINDPNDNFSLFYFIDRDENYCLSLSNLCLKSQKETINTDENNKSKYDDILSNIDSLYKYYLKKQDDIEEKLFPTQSQYNLIINISLVYKLLDLGKYFLDEWIKSDNSLSRVVVIPKDLSYKNYYNGNILDFDKADFDSIEILLEKFYKSNYLRKEILEEIDNFISYCSFSESEQLLFFVYISISKIIDIDNMIEVNSLNFYVQETYDYLLKKYKEKKESN